MSSLKKQQNKHLTVTTHRLGVETLPVGTVRAADCVVCSVSLDTKTSVFATGRCESPALAVLVNGVDDPVDSRIISNNYVLRIHHDHLEIFVSGILVHPVRVENAQVAAVAASTLLSNATQVPGKLKLVDTLVLGLTVDNALVIGSLATTTADCNAENAEPLLGLVPKLVCFVSAGRSSNLGHFLALTVFPCSV